MFSNKKSNTFNYQNSYDTLKTEDDYSCSSGCTCKYLQNRSSFDVMQRQLWEKQDKNLYNQYAYNQSISKHF
jgi:hypothetical protein